MSRLVYSTDQGRLCPECGYSHCQCNDDSSTMGDGNVRIRLETKGRKGKGVTTITGIPLAEVELKKLLKELKQKTSSGGSVKGHTLELQGDHRDILIMLLANRGWPSVKKAGG
ncbi:MAG: stress response translation initiation inhibitor YciH [Pseudomonadales bacterium]|nr:stress response translation initiation inhibitor YciH [Pseudomonadales bacterium]